ncbi:MAG: cobyrinate a,c-diamide synthase [Firmicutes bacterium]|nr:cobyrinate a,c-diamide synthase [Bacillota bacterium]
MKRILIAGTHSGVGKTTVTAAVIAALKRRGYSIVPFKVGSDFIDPGFHAVAAGMPAGNLDSWILSPAQIREILHRRVPPTAVAVIEGVMGIYDGRKGGGELGSSAHVAKITKTPVLLVASGAKMARSAAAMVGGYVNFDPEVHFAGVIFNHLGSASHFQILKEAVETSLKIPVIGWLPHNLDITIPERHLGLVPAWEGENLAQLFTYLAELAERYFDLDAIIKIAAAAAADKLPPVTKSVLPQRQLVKCRLAMALDEAFHFYYPENLLLLEALGAELVPFSPLHDARLPANCQGVLLGGGFPEMYAKALAANQALRRELKVKAEAGMPIYAESGGYMYLAQALTTIEGETYPMCGIFPGRARMHTNRQALGYVEVKGTVDNKLLPPEESCRGHEFRWSEMEAAGSSYLYRTREQTFRGERKYNCFGSYIHLHFFSNPRLPQRFLKLCSETFTN